MLAYIILGLTYAFAAAVQPGQFQAYLISQALMHGWRRTLPAALAPIVSDLPAICLVLLVLTRVPAVVLNLLQLAGGAFLLYVAWSALRSSRREPAQSTSAPVPKHRTLLKAALVNVLNPNPYLAWALVLGPLLLKAWHEGPGNGIALVLAFYSMLVAGSAAIIVLFAQARALGPRIAQALVVVSAVALLAFGSLQVWLGTTALFGRDFAAFGAP